MASVTSYETDSLKAALLGQLHSSNSSRAALVIPTIRSIDPMMLKYVPAQIALIVVEDRETASVQIPWRSTKVYSYADRKKYWDKRNESLIARQTSACRTFGYLVAWESGSEYVLTLDDDCYPRSDWWYHWWFNQLDPLRAVSGEYTSNTTWINTLHILQKRGFARGLPFDYRDTITKYQPGTFTNRIVAQVGLWSGHLDVSAVDKVIEDFPWADEHVDKEVPSVRVANDVALPWSGMNYAFHTDILPLMMHWHNHEYPLLDRYDDIWMGYIAKRVIDMMGDGVLVGGPIVDHVKRGDSVKELRKERYGETISYWLYTLVDIFLEQYQGERRYLDITEYLGRMLETKIADYKVPTMWREYLSGMGRVIRRWCALLERRGFGK